MGVFMSSMTHSLESKSIHSSDSYINMEHLPDQLLYRDEEGYLLHYMCLRAWESSLLPRIFFHSLNNVRSTTLLAWAFGIVVKNWRGQVIVIIFFLPNNFTYDQSHLFLVLS